MGFALARSGASDVGDSMRSIVRMAIAGGVAFLAVIAANAVHAEMEVTASDVAEIQVGTALPDDARLKLPKNSTVRLMTNNLNGQFTITLNGPFEGTVAEYKKRKHGWWRKWLNRNDGEASRASTRGGGVQTPEKDK
jgi:hypothetical protein